jgi:hypothetical protein
MSSQFNVHEHITSQVIEAMNQLRNGAGVNNPSNHAKPT